MKRILFILFLTVTVLAAGELKKLTFKQVYVDKENKIFNSLPSIRDWADSEHFYLEKEDKLFKVRAGNGKSRLVLDPQEYEDVLGEDFDLLDAEDRTKDLDKFLFLKDDDIFLFLRAEKKIVQVTATAEEEQDPKFSPDQKKIAYTGGGNLFVYEIASQKNRQLTSDGSEEILNGCASYIYYEEVFPRETKAFWWSPDSRKIVFMRFDQGKVPLFPIFKSKGIYGELEEQRYPKPGFPNPQVKIGIADLKKGLQWIDFKDPQDHYLAFPTWNKKGDKIYFQWLNRGQDHLKILVYSLVTRHIEPVYAEKQKTWVEFLAGRDLHLLETGGMVLRSSKDGWYHIYYLDKTGAEKQVTSGEWSVTAVENVDPKRKVIYFSARREDSTETDFYKTGPGYNGKKIIRLTQFKGSHRVKVSPTGKYFIDRYSSITTPTRLEIRNSKGKSVRKIADSYTPQIKEYDLGKTEMFRIETGDGYSLPARWTLPPGFDKTRKYPLIFRIYGGPGASTARNSYPRLSYFFLAQQDIIVFSVDHRGSGHFGKKGIDLMYRSLGKWEMHDYIQAVKYLRTLSFVDSEKIGIRGGSYGGYATSLALTRAAEYFQCGIAGASVIDWALYDSIYTERYMDTPEENPEGYKDSSVLTYVDKYKSGSLRITHGLMDDNVHMQNTIQFVDKVLDEGKSIEVMLYPGQRHGYRAKKGRDNNRAAIDFWLRKFYNKEFKE